MIDFITLMPTFKEMVLWFYEIIYGKKYSGVTLQRYNENVDGGDIYVYTNIRHKIFCNKS